MCVCVCVGGGVQWHRHIYVYLFTNLQNWRDIQSHTGIKHDKTWMRYHRYISGDKIILSKLLFSLVISAVRYLTLSTIPSPFTVVLIFLLHAIAYSVHSNLSLPCIHVSYKCTWLWQYYHSKRGMRGVKVKPTLYKRANQREGTNQGHMACGKSPSKRKLPPVNMEAGFTTIK